MVHERPWGTVRRLPEGWLKECAPVQAFEPRLTAALARRWPDRLPVVLDHDDARRTLLLADAGERLGIGGEPAPWLDVLPLYAELQRGEEPHTGAHLAGGVPDRRLARYPELYESTLARTLPLPDRDLRRLRAFAPRFAELSRELATGGLPETIQHDDLHGNNVFRDGAALRILDWGDACVAHPFTGFRVTVVHLFLPAGDAWRGRLRDAYLEPWGDAREPFELAQRLAPFAHLFALLRVLDAVGVVHLPDLEATLDECLLVAR